jgi:hypothetical protein
MLLADRWVVMKDARSAAPLAARKAERKGALTVERSAPQWAATSAALTAGTSVDHSVTHLEQRWADLLADLSAFRWAARTVTRMAAHSDNRSVAHSALLRAETTVAPTAGSWVVH